MNYFCMEWPLAAARDGDLNTLKTLVAERGWDPLQTVDKHGSCTLHWAAGAGQLETCRYLVETCGVDPCVRRRRGKKSKVRSIHWSPYDRVGEVNADP